MLTIKELQDLGYEFKISGKAYCVTYRPRLKVGADFKSHDDTVDAWKNALIYGAPTFRTSASTPQIQNIPRQTGKALPFDHIRGMGGGSVKLVFDEVQYLYPGSEQSKVVIRGKIDLGYGFRKQRGGAPQRMNMKQVTELCIKAATADYVKRQLLR